MSGPHYPEGALRKYHDQPASLGTGVLTARRRGAGFFSSSEESLLAVAVGRRAGLGTSGGAATSTAASTAFLGLARRRAAGFAG